MIRSPAPDSGLPCFVIAAATGGLQAFSRILPALRPPVPPILAIPRIHPAYAAAFAERLQRVCSVAVKVAAEGDLVLPDRVLIVPGDCHVELAGTPPRTCVTIRQVPPGARGERRREQSFDVAFRSAARVYGRDSVGILLTGLGRDGVDGCKAILAAGGIALGQDAATSVVYGPSRIALDEGALSTQFPLDELPGILQDFSTYRDRLEKGTAIDSPAAATLANRP
jgi:two-component system, chemotaxis family, protein-glutamate methylesterase/glutaminase